jgi:ubiquinone/menaquinone biosynthesis C-methylase UbiE
MTESAFRDLEHAGWVAKGPAYRNVFGKITEQAIEPILSTFGDVSDKRFLDVACGTGELAAAAAARGASAEGIDFAATMIEQAKGRYSNATFTVGDAERLPHGDHTLDAVSCSFGLLHLANPDGAIAEAKRVLRSGGRYTFTVWCSPDQGCDFFKLVLDAVQRHGTLNVPLPPAPPIFRFSSSEECFRVLETTKFKLPSISRLELQWHTPDPQGVLDLIYKGVVRTPMILEAQAQDSRDRIHSAILEGAEHYRRGSQIELRFPAVLVTAVA